MSEGIGKSENAALSISDLSYNYGMKKALDNVSFTIPDGRFCALLGPNGAGKSTLFSLLTRLFVSGSGSIEVAGHDLRQDPNHALGRIGVVFQQPTLDLDLSVMRNLLYFAALHGIGGKAARLRAEEVLARLNMQERAGERVRDLNGGHRRRMEIARSLIHRPAVLLLDEPTVGLDAPSRRAITEHVHELTETGLSVLWATHLVDEIYSEDQVIVLHKGKIIRTGTAREISGAQTLGDAFAELTGEAAQ